MAARGKAGKKAQPRTRRKTLAPGLSREVDLKQQLAEARVQQTATAEILSVIARSPSDVQPVFDAIVESAARLFGRRANLRLVEGGGLRRKARSGTAANSQSSPELLAIDKDSYLGRTVLEKRALQVPDMRAADASPLARANAHKWDFRASAAAPLLRNGNAIGVIAVTSPDPGLMSDNQMALLSTFADQAVIAIENVRLFNETKEALERQTATAEILKVIASSPSDVQPALDAIMRSAMRLFEPWRAVVLMRRGDMVELSAVSEIGLAQSDMDALKKIFPAPYDPEKLMVARAIEERRLIEVPDTESSPEQYPLIAKTARAGRYRSAAFVPLIREGEGIGVIVLTHPTAGARLTENQLALVQTFANQAVIAIQNARLFNETKEALERQTATAEILRVIAGSPTDVQPVFDAIAASATRLLDGFSTAVVRVADGQVHLAGITSTGESGDEALRQVFPVPVGKAPGNVGRAIREKAASWTEDAEADPSYSDEFRAAIRARGWRSGVAVPMVRNNDVIGAINVTRRATGPFTDHQIGLLKTFADQAVIAIENVRLFNETREALERQTATAEILKVIASSPSDVQPVFDAILGSAVNLCSAEIAAVFPYDGKLVHLGATYNWSEEALKYFSTVYPSPPSPALLSGRTVLGKSIVQIVDAAADTHYDQNSATTGHWRRMLGVPMMREGQVLGALVVCWREPGETPQRQVDLLQTFADQAVIAIQNVRLFNETKEALERQTATAEILKVIASSPSNVQPVFDAILESATRLCDGHFGILGLYEGESYKYVAHRGSNEKFANWVIENGQYKPRPGGGIARMTVERRPIHMADVREAKAYRDGNPVTLALADIGGVRTYLSVPMLKEDRVIGGITIYRPEVRPFSDKQIDLVSTFASQAVIAIENVRLFHEIEDKGRQLEVASQHKSNFLASMSHELRTPLNAILGFNEMIIGQVYGEVPADMQEPLNDIQTSGKHLLRLINNVLDLAKIEAGRMELSLQDYSVHDTVSSVHSTLRPLAAEKGLEFLATVPNDVPLAYGDGGRIAQCLMNLAGNSLKFTKAGKVEISVEAKGDLLVYKVTDTGIGIPPDKIGSLFTEFKQTDATIASEYGGTGLGLSISRKFVEMHGGRIWVESELGKGSAFIIEVPIRVKTP